MPMEDLLLLLVERMRLLMEQLQGLQGAEEGSIRFLLSDICLLVHRTLPPKSLRLGG